MRVEQLGQVRQGWLPIEISLDCSDVAAGPGGVRLAEREHATVQVPATFPFSLPGVRVTHSRFAGLPYVLNGHQICLYHSDSDWNPARGMFGVIGRLIAWYRRAAAARPVACSASPPACSRGAAGGGPAAWSSRGSPCILRSRIRCCSGTPTASWFAPTCPPTSSRPPPYWCANIQGALTSSAGCARRR